MTLIQLYSLYFNDIVFWRSIIVMSILSIITIIFTLAVIKQYEECEVKPTYPAIYLLFIVFLLTFFNIQYINKQQLISENDYSKIIQVNAFRGWAAEYYPQHMHLLTPLKLENK